ncbi:hypothetical protein [Kiloniella antarctica]|uniref:Cation/multidrug efflux pump n=1 Tax=Kiloniella antarctica TaxID=1550907 RepID=A0ABW5BNE0_9PROT
MILWLFRLVIIFGILTVIYIALSFYYRWDKKRELVAEYKANSPKDSIQTNPDQELENYITQGISNYDHSLKKKLLLGVYAVPLIIIFGLLFIANFM